MAVHGIYFSATQTTAKIVKAVASSVANALSQTVEIHDITSPKQRWEAGLVDTTNGEIPSPLSFSATDIVIFGVPVYIGRVPNLMKPFFAKIKGNGATGIPMVVYGNRHYDDALIELRDLMEEGQFRCDLAAAAFIGEHSFSTILGAGRPDLEDLAIAEDFGKVIAKSITMGKRGKLPLPGNVPYRFFSAVDDQGKPFDIRKVKPKTKMDLCDGCGYCAEICPMGSINPNNLAEVNGICIKCNACVKRCPNAAKYFDDDRYLEHLGILERKYASKRCQPSIWIAD